ncbi:hypothetical protein AG1IA_06825 [Rhizoctonia solani AG-1 IA]|uniref:Uncharacterized protein n=1 Tax=Thanatephorus cucumeris (strain AG1-IA) TaxID=983506 RepID=L8WQS7_THACA|nr:hypothetical protein AG1IA_06825 [Rhizoctonia solani AG-1 IA]
MQTRQTTHKAKPDYAKRERCKERNEKTCELQTPFYSTISQWHVTRETLQFTSRFSAVAHHPRQRNHALLTAPRLPATQYLDGRCLRWPNRQP